MTPRSTLEVKVIGQKSRSPGQKPQFEISFCSQLNGGNVRGQESHVSRSMITWVKAKAYVGQGQPIGHDIGRWAHVNVKLHFYYFREATILKLEGMGFKNNYEPGGGWGTKFCIPISFCNL